MKALLLSLINIIKIIVSLLYCHKGGNLWLDFVLVIAVLVELVGLELEDLELGFKNEVYSSSIGAL
uniref:Uncharacterized protein n=1 Tax=uncultured Elusimicrobia bacterium TaxID=699876 RepID=A0A650ELN5_9BACT|nr:hypothetical protein Elusimicrob1349_1970 [uncultured Elusimicrobia bacterium]